MNIIGKFTEIVTKKYAQFKGRASRAEYWQYILVMAIIYGIVGIIISFLPQSMSMVGFILYGIVALGLLLPTLAVNVRRMHDLGKGGGWLFITLVPFIGGLWYFILTVQAGETNKNRFDDQEVTKA